MENRYELSQDGNYCKIFLRNSEQYFLIDADDMDEVLKHYWYLTNRGYVQSGNFPYKNGKRVRKYLHRFLLNPDPSLVVDHINHNQLDNRRCNLRVCSNQENCRNRSLNKTSKTGYKGVSYVPETGKYHARIKINQKTKFLGSYNTLAEAISIRQETALSVFGEFANPAMA